MKSLIKKLLREGLSIGPQGIAGKSDIDDKMLVLSDKIEGVLLNKWFYGKINGFKLHIGDDDYRWYNDEFNQMIIAELFPKFLPTIHIDLYRKNGDEWKLVNRKEIPISLDALDADHRDVYEFYFSHLRDFIEKQN